MKRVYQLKGEALDALTGKFGKAALASLGIFAISLAISVLLQVASGTNIIDYYIALFENDYAELMDALGDNIYVSSIRVLVTLLFTLPLNVGIINTYRVLLESKGSDNTFFRNFFKLAFCKNYLHIVLVAIISAFLIGLMILPAFLLVALFIFLFQNGVVTVILFVLAFLYTIWITLTYSMICFIVLDNPKLDIIDTMRRSRHLMEGNKWRFFVLWLSFLGWILLGILTLGIGYLWLFPYIYTTQSAFYCDIRDAENAEQA